MKNELTAKRIQLALSNANIKPQELADRSGIGKASISQYVNGSHAPGNVSAERIGKILDVNPLWLMGFDVNMKESIAKDTHNLSNIYPIELKRFPMLGEIACGKPIYANEDRESYIMAGTNIEADFCLKAKGDSMINARIMDGDIVFIREQDIVDNGEIAAVVVNNDSEATLKRFYYYAEKSMIILKSENPTYEDMIFTNDELENFHVLGKAVAFQSDVR